MKTEDIPYPGLAMVDDCLAPFRRCLDVAGKDTSSFAILGFFEDFVADCEISEFEAGSDAALRLRDRGCEEAATEECAGSSAPVDDDGSAAIFVADRVTLGDMR